MRTVNFSDLDCAPEEHIDPVVDDRETDYIRSSERIMDDIKQGEKDLKEGKGIELDLESL